MVFKGVDSGEWVVNINLLTKPCPNNEIINIIDRLYSELDKLELQQTLYTEVSNKIRVNVLKMRYGLHPYTHAMKYREIGLIIGKSHERIRQYDE